MSPVGKVFSIINGLIDALGPSIRDTILKVFYFIIFVLLGIGAYFGYSWGKNAASIKSSPIAGTTNQVFDMDIKRERESGTFRDMLESEAVNELKMSDPNKIKYPMKEDLESNIDTGIVEPKKDQKIWAQPDMASKNMIFEGDYNKLERKEADTRGIQRKGSPFDDKKDEIVDADAPKLDADRKPLDSGGKKDNLSDDTSLKKEKRGLIRRKESGPRLINRDTDIIKN